jgi:hypothetical protein
MPTLTISRPKPVRLKSAVHDELRTALKAVMEPLFRQYFHVLPNLDAVGTLALDLNELLPGLAKTDEVALEHYKALIRGAAARAQMLEAHGGCVSADAASNLLSLSKTRVLERYQEGSILGVRVEKQNAVKFPVWQFQQGAPKVRPGVKETIAVFREIPPLDDWAVMTFFLSPRDSLGAKAPVDLLLAGQHKRAVNLARTDVD